MEESSDKGEKSKCQCAGVEQSSPANWEYMASTSVIHGIGKIGSAPNRFLKVLWLLCLLTMCSVMIYQLVQLTTVFVSSPVKTSVSLAFNPLVLPAITLCNSNPVRQSRVHSLNCSLQALLRVEDQYKSEDCVNETISLRRDPEMLCKKYNLFCTANNTEDVDLYFLRKKRTQLELVQADRATMQDAGHQIEDMIINCTFSGVKCFANSFVREWTMEYGNCYTMSTSSFLAYDSGPPSGLDLIVDLQTEEMLASFKTGYGLRVVVHEQGTRPFPSSEGFTLGAGFETHFGLRLEEVTRLGGRYGNCRRDDSGLFDEVDFKYTTKACRTLCVEKAEIDRCGCTDAIARTATPTQGSQICTHASEFNCTGELNKEYFYAVSHGDNFCPCGNSCEELVYRVRTSSRNWPISSYIPVLEEEVCRINHGTEAEVSHCRDRKASNSMEERMSSYVRLRVYFETLNYEQIVQEPFYNAERFLSDIGGTLGLWIGASLLGLGEALELLFFSLLVLCRRVRGARASFNHSTARGTASTTTHGYAGTDLTVVIDRAYRNDSSADLVENIGNVAV